MLRTEKDLEKKAAVSNVNKKGWGLEFTLDTYKAIIADLTALSSGGGGGGNIYDTDDSLTSNRTVDTDGSDLSFIGERFGFPTKGVDILSLLDNGADPKLYSEVNFELSNATSVAVATNLTTVYSQGIFTTDLSTNKQHSFAVEGFTHYDTVTANITTINYIPSTGSNIIEIPDASGKIALEETVVRTIQIAASDETTDLTVDTNKITFRMPYAFTLTGVRASVTTAPTGADLIVDINESGVTILSTKLTIDAGDKTSVGSAVTPVISDTALADDAEITIDIDQIGSTIAGAGLKITLIGTKA